MAPPVAEVRNAADGEPQDDQARHGEDPNVEAANAYQEQHQAEDRQGCPKRAGLFDRLESWRLLVDDDLLLHQLV
jgi:hypothetical protein